VPSIPEVPAFEVPTMPSADSLGLPQDVQVPEVKLPELGLPDIAGQIPSLDVPAVDLQSMVPQGLTLPDGVALPEGFALPEGVTLPEFTDAASAQQWLDALVKTGVPPPA
jgi:hypothetical protein